MSTARRRRRWPWIVAAVVLVLLIPVAVVVVPILTHVDGGDANQQETAEQWPTAVSATGDDGYTRELAVHSPQPGGVVDTSAVAAGDRIVVSGTGYDAGQGIYVAVCVIPADPAEKPGPCVGGVPDEEQQPSEAGAVEWAESNWINDEWAWRMFGARAYDDVATGTFTAYLELGAAVGEGWDCTVDACAIYTRNDHTASNDRVQDLFVPIAYADRTSR